MHAEAVTTGNPSESNLYYLSSMRASKLQCRKAAEAS